MFAVAPSCKTAASGCTGARCVFNLRTNLRSFAVLSHKWAHQPDAKLRDGKQRVVVLLHGILGSKANWSTPARRLTQQVGPLGWRVLQLDHRAHGHSPAGASPHCLASCAEDVEETLTGLGVGADAELVICGHSFGGKVAVAFARRRLAVGTPPRMTWLFDSVPGLLARTDPEEARRDQSAAFVISVIERLAGRTFTERAELLEALESEGLSKPIAQWIAQTVRSTDNGITLGYDAAVVRALYDDYCSTDFWEVLESSSSHFGVVVAGKNRRAWGEENLARLTQCVGLNVVTLENAGHNVHVDDLAGLLDALTPTFAE